MKRVQHFIWHTGIIYLVIIVFLSGNASGSAPNWVPLPNQQYNMNIIGKLELSPGVYSTNANDIVGAFVGGDCRGVISPDAGAGGLLFLTIGSNQVQGETVTFKAYLSATGQVVDLNQTVVFQNQQLTGSPGTPYIFTSATAPALYELSLSVDPAPSPTGGTVTGEGSYSAGTMVEICAYPLPGWEFVHWKHGSTIISTQACFQYSMPASNASLTAFFSYVGDGPPNWTPLPNQQYNMNIIGKLELSPGVYSTNPNDIVGAFVGGVCRGVISPDAGAGGLLFLTIGSNQVQGETVTFKAYLSGTGQVVDLNQTVVFQNQQLTGNPSSPYIFSFSAAEPMLTVNPESLNFGNVLVNTNSSPLSYLLTGNNLTGNVTVNAPSRYQVSLSQNSGYGSSVSVSPSGGIVSRTIYVRFNPSATGVISGNITNSSTGAITQSVAVTGNGSTCLNTNHVLSVGQTYPNYSMEVSSVSLSPANPLPGQNVTANVTWKANSCPSCIVKANVFGSWNTSTQITSIHDGFNQNKTTSFTFIAPSIEGNYSLRLIWAFDIGAFSNYTGSNLPSSSQCTSWGNSTAYVVDKTFSVSGSVTPCPPLSTPFTEFFNSSEWPNCWTQTFSGTIPSNRWSVENSSNAGGQVNELRANWVNGTGTSRLISPPINLTGISQVELEFRHLYDDWGQGATLLIQSSADGITWKNEAFTIASGSGNKGPEIVKIPITTFSTTTYIAWVIIGNHYQFNWWYIDDVKVSSGGQTPTNREISFESVYFGESKCFDATNSIVVPVMPTHPPGGATILPIPNFDVHSGASATLVAGQSIRMLPGTRIHSGGYLRAYITTTSSYCAPAKTEDIHEEFQSEEVITSVEETWPEREIQFFKVYPNPTTGSFTLELGDFIEAERVYVEVYNTLGSLLINQELPNEMQHTLSLADQQPGIYIVRVMAGDRMGIQRLIRR